MKFYKIFLIVLSALLMPQSTFASGSSKPQSIRKEGQKPIVVSTPWVGAIVALAGGQQIVTLAPGDMLHPADYELTPSDVVAVANSRIIFYAGYERMAEKLQSETADGEIRLESVRTVNSPQNLIVMIGKISDILGTPEVARKSIAKIEEFYDGWHKDIKDAGATGKSIIVHLFQKDVMESLGFSVAETFGPAPLSAEKIVSIANSQGVLIVDNGHNPVAEPLAKEFEKSFVSLFNFPIQSSKESFFTLLEENRKAFMETLVE